MKLSDRKINHYLDIVLSRYQHISRDSIVVRFRPLSVTMTMRPKLSFLWTPKTAWKFLLTINSNAERNVELMTESEWVGFLAHEMSHVSDYQKKSRMEIISLGFWYLTSSKYKRLLERKIDSDVIMKGFGHELLKSYTQVLRLDDSQADYIKTKKKFYLSPEEIVELLQRQERRTL